MKINNKKPYVFADYAYGAIALSTKKIIKNEKGVLHNKNPEYIHQMRVGLRRLRSVLIGFYPALKLPKLVDEKKIGKVAQILGKKRDNDVLKENLTKYYYHFLNDGEKKICDQFMEKLDNKNKDNQNKIIKVLQGKEYQNIKYSLKKWLKEPQFNLIASLPITEVAHNLIIPQISKLHLQSGWFVGTKIDQNYQITIKEDYTLEEVKNLLEEEKEIIHELRKEAKKTRYQMDLLTDCYGQPYHDYLNLIVNVQEILGNIQDNAILLNQIKKEIGKNWQKKLPNLDILISNNQRQQWLNWRKIQQLFLLDNQNMYEHNLLMLKKDN
ncbi:CHAD domain-containing protein [Cyanobacterium stanieri LEGE 03274]|uniref:CHAD domain-containing protein n=1 Tax=Cyanobacterium stanieri LEGE 03274 TaxID=1828756 RepID=A0ABR9V4H9_9CHRO|nr:CHAD domain-containing protein [Cyanobacterium stanieri]MBE9222757.1 CHAD domain-containing protein [Cyanobacterium stanieri LEGE 03274]